MSLAAWGLLRQPQHGANGGRALGMETEEQSKAER